MKEKLNSMFSDDRAVSPVIGVILMVAITVILAAVIGTFVLGLGDSLGDTQPTTSLDVDVSNGDFVVEHRGGDTIEAGDLRVIVEVNGTTDIDQRNLFGDTFEVGDTNSTTYTEASSSVANDVRVRIIHLPSESTLLDRTIRNVQVGDSGSEFDDF